MERSCGACAAIVAASSLLHRLCMKTTLVYIHTVHIGRSIGTCGGGRLLDESTTPIEKLLLVSNLLPQSYGNCHLFSWLGKSDYIVTKECDSAVFFVITHESLFIVTEHGNYDQMSSYSLSHHGVFIILCCVGDTTVSSPACHIFDVLLISFGIHNPAVLVV